MKKNFLFLTSFFIFFLLYPISVSAHDSTLTYTSISIIDQTINVAITTPYKNILGIYPEKDIHIDAIDPKFFTKHFENGLIVKNNGEQCKPNLTNVQKIPDTKQVAYQFEFRCKKELDTLRFSYNLFFNVSEAHENITDIYYDEFGEQIIFSKKLQAYDFPAKEMRTKTNTYHTLWNAFNFFIQGINHIFIGIDHVLFVLGLVLLTKSFRSLIKIITAFTIAHSITLILSSMSIISLPTRLTESLIAFSIIYLAIENILILKNIKTFSIGNLKLEIRNWKIFSQKSLWLVAFLFGLIHGFGFSSVLRELGLPQNGLITSLISFNIGIEIGQIAIISAAFPILWYMRKKKRDKKIALVTSAAIGVLGLFWFIEKVFS